MRNDKSNGINRAEAIVFVIPVLLQAVSVLVLGLIGASVFYRPTNQFIFSFLFVFFVGGGQEELGWRGFALPRLQAAYGAFAASFIIGVVWAIWHFPLYLIDGASMLLQHSLPHIGSFLSQSSSRGSTIALAEVF